MKVLKPNDNDKFIIKNYPSDKNKFDDHFILTIEELASNWEGPNYYQIKLAQSLALKTSLKALEEHNVYYDYVKYIIDYNNPNDLKTLKINKETDPVLFEIIPYH